MARQLPTTATTLSTAQTGRHRLRKRLLGRANGRAPDTRETRTNTREPTTHTKTTPPQTLRDHINPTQLPVHKTRFAKMADKFEFPGFVGLSAMQSLVVSFVLWTSGQVLVIIVLFHLAFWCNLLGPFLGAGLSVLVFRVLLPCLRKAAPCLPRKNPPFVSISPYFRKITSILFKFTVDTSRWGTSHLAELGKSFFPIFAPFLDWFTLTPVESSRFPFSVFQNNSLQFNLWPSIFFWGRNFWASSLPNFFGGLTLITLGNFGSTCGLSLLAPFQSIHRLSLRISVALGHWSFLVSISRGCKCISTKRKGNFWLGLIAAIDLCAAGVLVPDVFSEYLTTHDVVSSVAHPALGFPPENPDAGCKFLLVDEGDFFSRSLSPTHVEPSVQCTNADLKKRVAKSFTHDCSTLTDTGSLPGNSDVDWGSPYFRKITSILFKFTVDTSRWGTSHLAELGKSFFPISAPFLDWFTLTPVESPRFPFSVFQNNSLQFNLWPSISFW